MGKECGWASGVNARLRVQKLEAIKLHHASLHADYCISQREHQ
jgi:hypothetical protein